MLLNTIKCRPTKSYKSTKPKNNFRSTLYLKSNKNCLKAHFKANQSLI